LAFIYIYFLGTQVRAASLPCMFSYSKCKPTVNKNKLCATFALDFIFLQQLFNGGQFWGDTDSRNHTGMLIKESG